MADHPENPFGETVSYSDILPIGLLLLPGTVLLLRFAIFSILQGQVRRITTGFFKFHGDASKWLVIKGFLRFPGVHLVTSIRGWICGELVLLAAILVAFGADFEVPKAACLITLGVFAAGASVVLSFREEAGRQLNAIRSALPVASFLMSLMLEAGMGSPAALIEVVRALPTGPLASELDEIARARILGVSRCDAIERSRCRVPLDEYRAFLNLIQQGERLGIAMSQGLRELSSRMMESQEHRAETIAQKAAVKLLFPLVVFIFPSVFLIILSPIILNLWDMLGR